MPTFTNENSALGDLNTEAKKTYVAPLIIGIFIATTTYLIFNETGALAICGPIGLFFGVCLTSICFQAEKEKAMLIEGEDPCMSSEPNEIMRPGLRLWLWLQGKYLMSALTVFGVLIFHGNPILVAYMNLKEYIPF
jgi:hypothetical protein